jgi:prophage regulatory protein
MTGAPRHHETRFDPASEVIRPRHLKHVVGLSAPTIWRLRRAGTFPPPLQLSPGRVGWRRCDLEQWLETRRAAR